MLPKRYRLRRAKEVGQLRKQGRAWRHPLAILLVDSCTDASPQVSRFAFSASRRVGNAVVRNRAKRLLRESVHQHLDEIETGWNCLFIARSFTPDASLAEVETAVLQLLKRAKLLKSKS
ncbi:MAG: ribonuclease P protein component [Chloroflexota bacterium]